MAFRVKLTDAQIDALTTNKLNLACAKQVGWVGTRTRLVNDSWQSPDGLSGFISSNTHEIEEIDPNATPPDYAHDLAAVWTLQAHIEREGLTEEYIAVLVGKDSDEEWASDDLWKLVDATPEQRARAYLKVIAHKGVDSAEQTG